MNTILLTPEEQNAVAAAFYKHKALEMEQAFLNARRQVLVLEMGQSAEVANRVVAEICVAHNLDPNKYLVTEDLMRLQEKT